MSNNEHINYILNDNNTPINLSRGKGKVTVTQDNIGEIVEDIFEQQLDSEVLELPDDYVLLRKTDCTKIRLYTDGKGKFYHLTRYCGAVQKNGRMCGNPAIQNYGWKCRTHGEWGGRGRAY